MESQLSYSHLNSLMGHKVSSYTHLPISNLDICVYVELRASLSLPPSLPFSLPLSLSLLLSLSPSLSIENIDFVNVAETFTFNIGDSRLCTNVVILGDNEFEGPEDFPLELISDDPNVNIGQSNAVVTIFDDDDFPPVFDFENPQPSFIENAGTVEVCVFLVSGTISENTPVTVQSARTGDTATGIHQ